MPGRKVKDEALSGGQTWLIIAGALKGALLIAGVFIGVFFLFILLLCVMA